jgi:hypothetical protein
MTTTHKNNFTYYLFKKKKKKKNAVIDNEFSMFYKATPFVFFDLMLDIILYCIITITQ